MSKSTKTFWRTILLSHTFPSSDGKNHEGLYLNSRGVDIKEFTAPLDELFILGSRSALAGIGDGGNEVGMGSFAHALQNKEFSMIIVLFHAIIL